MDRLLVNSTLHSGMELPSATGKYKLICGHDGDLRIEAAPVGVPVRVGIWSSQTRGKSTGPFRLVMQDDSNLVLYDGNNAPIWATDTCRRGAGQAYAVLHDDGNLVLYDVTGAQLWSSRGNPQRHGGGAVAPPASAPFSNDRLSANGTLQGGSELHSANRQFRLSSQGDGNVVVYGPGNAPIWSSQTNGKSFGPYRLVMQADNNLVMYDAGNSPIWASGTNGKGAGQGYVKMQDDGNLVLYDAANTALWCTRTDGGRQAPPEYQGRGHTLVDAGAARGPAHVPPHVPHHVPHVPHHVPHVPHHVPHVPHQVPGFAPPSAPALHQQDTLASGAKLEGGSELHSANRQFRLSSQADGNVVVYGPGNAPIWSSQTNGKSRGPYMLLLQADNNLVMYDGNNAPIWAAGTDCKGTGKAYAKMQDDGNFVIMDAANTALWCTRTDGGRNAPPEYQGRGHLLVNTPPPAQHDSLHCEVPLQGGSDLHSANRQFRLSSQTDGNVVVYGPGNQAIWSSQTHGKSRGPYRLIVQGDNNLVMYDARNSPIWASGTNGKGTGRALAKMQDDGNLVLLDATLKPLWCTRTDGGRNAPPEFQGRGHLLV